MAVSRTKKGIPAVVVHPTYGAYSGDSKNTTEIHFCKEEKKIFVGDILYSSEKSCLCGSDAASTGGWYKLGQLECDSTAQVNVNVICSIMETYNSAYSGLFVLQARHEKSGSWSIKKLQWLARIGFSATAIKCVVDGNKAYLYAYKTTTQYSRLFVKVLCESGWNNRIPYLFLADNSTPETSTPGGTTITECCAPTATTATNLASAPVIAAGTTSTNAITVTAGGKKSAEFTVPYATNAGSATSAGSLAANSYINTHPENNGTIIPFMNNDLAFLLRKGGSAVVKFDNTVVEKDISNVFDGTASYWAGNNLSSLGYSSMTIELTLHKAFAHGTTFYIDFGNVGWRAKTVKVEVINTNYADDVWTTKINRTNNGSGHVNGSVGHAPVGGSNGSGFNKIRITLSDWNNPTDCRIAEIGLLNYASGGLSETFLSKGGGKVYGNILPFKNNTYDLGSDTNRWRNIYGTASNVTVASGSTDAYRAIVVHNGNTLYSAGTNTGKPRYNYASGDVMAKSFTTDGGNFNGNATSATTATKVSQVLRIKDAGSSGDGITYNGSSELGITVPTEMVGSMTGGGILLKVPSKAAIGLGNVDNTADANKSVKSATTATNLASAPVIAAGTTITNAITVTAGGKKSAEFTVPYATKAGSATSATTASKVAKSFILSDGSGTVKFDGSADITLTVPADMIHSATNSGFSLKRESKTFCATISSVVSATPFWKIKLTSYSDNFNGYAPQNGDTLFLWVKNAVASSTTAYPFCIPYGTAGESDNSKCIPLYHGQNTGTPKEWLGSTALSAGFYMFVFRSDVRGTSTAITTNGGWVFLYRNVSTT